MKISTKFTITIILFALLVISVPLSPAQAATLTVTSTADTMDPGTLRYAVSNAAAGDTIEFDLSYPAIIELNTPLEITESLTISGPGQENLSIDGGGHATLILNTAVNVAINDLTLTNGLSAAGSAIYKSATAGTITVTRVTFTDNKATDSGGAIYTQGPVVVSESVFVDNQAFNNGGAVSASSQGSLVISDTTFTDNKATNGDGGAIYFDALNVLQISSSTFLSNQSNNTGGAAAIISASSASLSNTTLFGNSTTTNGGGVYSTASPVYLYNTTFSNNSAATGGGLFNTGQVYLYNNIIANNVTGNDCINSGTIAGSSNNIIETGTCSGEITDDPMLDALADNGGPTQTMALLSGSPAIDAGDATICAAAPVSNLDQRGEARPVDGDGDETAICDIGAYEYYRITPTLSVTNSPVPYSGSPQAAVVSGSVPGSVSNILYDGSSTVPTEIGTYAVTADFTPDDLGTYNALAGASAGSFVIEAETVAPTVDSFAAATPSSSLDISITAFTASDNVAVTGYMITESSTAPETGDAGWSGTAPTTYSVAHDGEYTLYPWAKDHSGNVSALYGSPLDVTVEALNPTVVSSLRADSSPTNAASVAFTVSFSEPVTGVDTTDFSLTATGDVSGAAVSNLSGSGSTYTVTVSTGTGDGTLRLDVLDDDTIIDGGSRPLDGGFTSGEAYTLDKTGPDTSIDSQPADPTADTSASFTFSSPGDAYSFECQLDGGGFAACSSPAEYSGLSDGQHTFEVRALDALGNPDATPASYIWHVDTLPPSVSSVIRADANPTNAASVDFTVTFSETVIGVDTTDFSLTTTGAVSGAFVSNVSGAGVSYTVTVSTGTGDGSIRLDVLDDDSILDIISSPLVGGFTSGESYDIDKTAPDTTIDLHPTDPSDDVSPSFEFSSPEGTATFECQLDGGGFTPCTSPHSYAGLSDGEHTFEVRAVDQLGNSDATPASYTWTIDTFSLLFWDDVETGDFSRWTRFNDGKGWLYPCEQAAVNGSWGACVERGDNDRRKQLIDETPIYQTSFSARFSFDINNLSMSEGERFRFVQVKMGAERPFFIVLKYQGGQYYIQLNTLSDDLTKTKSSWYLLTDTAHTLEIDWMAASGPGANNGTCELYLDGSLQKAITGLDNDTIFVDSFKVGFTSRLEGKTISGIFYVDDVATTNDGYIGLP